MLATLKKLENTQDWQKISSTINIIKNGIYQAFWTHQFIETIDIVEPLKYNKT